MTEKTLWGIHGGRSGDADGLFLRRKRIGLGWKEIGDLSGLEPTREAIKAAVARTYPQKSSGGVSTSAGQLFRFLTEVNPGDIVVYPSKIDRKVHIGVISGDYTYDPKTEEGYPHQRSVEWKKHIPRTDYSQGALYEIGSALSFFQVKNYADEHLAHLEGLSVPTPEDDDQTVAQVADDIEEATRDYILKTLARKLKGHPFAGFVAHLLNRMGYKTRVSPEGPDGGIDIIAHRDKLGFEPPLIKVQVKSKVGSIGEPEVSALYGKVEQDEYGLFVTLGEFTKPALKTWRGKSRLRLIDGNELVRLILGHYEDFESQYKGILQLKKVYVPDAVTEEST